MCIFICVYGCMLTLIYECRTKPQSYITTERKHSRTQTTC